jgi:hypothetical protein
MTEPLDDYAHPTGRRSSGRARICLAAQLETVSGRYSAQLISLSCTGAGAAIEEPPKLGTDLIVKCGPIEAFGMVIWAHDGHCGIKFDEAIAKDVVLAARMASEHKSELAQADLIADAKEWAKGQS